MKIGAPAIGRLVLVVGNNMEKEKTQCERVLEALENHRGEWVSGQYFLRTLFLSQYHARIFELQTKGHEIEASDFTDNFGFKSYRLLNKEVTQGILL